MVLLHPELVFPLILFAAVGAFTPGPNNMMLMSLGLTYGMRRSLNAILGVAFGYAFLTLCVGLGLGALFTLYPILYVILKYAGGAYMLYLAYCIATSSPPNPDAQKQKKPVGFWQAAALQWINPKGIVMAISAISTYAPIATYPLNVYLIAGLGLIVSFGSTATWAGLGAVMQRFLHKPKLVRAFNIVMALLLAASLYPIIQESIK